MVLWYHIRFACGRPWVQIPACPLLQTYDEIYLGTWCNGITSASHAEGPGFKSQCDHFSHLLGNADKYSLSKTYTLLNFPILLDISNVFVHTFIMQLTQFSNYIATTCGSRYALMLSSQVISHDANSLL